MANNGWVKLHRSITDHWVWDCEFSYAQAWIDLLIFANHAEKKLTIKGQLITIERGQQARSEVTLSKSWKWSRNKVRRFLKNLENDGMISQKTTHLTSIITICNYDDFQSSDTADGTAKGQQTEHVKDSKRNTNKNVKNKKNEKEDITPSRFDEFWDLYDKKRSLETCRNKFNKLTEAEVDKIFEVLPAYVASTPDKQFRKDPSTWLNQKCWNDEIEVSQNSEQYTKPDWMRGML